MDASFIHASGCYCWELKIRRIPWFWILLEISRIWKLITSVWCLKFNVRTNEPPNTYIHTLSYTSEERIEVKRPDRSHNDAIGVRRPQQGRVKGPLLKMDTLEEYAGLPGSQLLKSFSRKQKVEWQFKLSEGIENLIVHRVSFLEWKKL